MGRAIVEDAVRTGAEVTLFGRGKTGTELFPELVRLVGDRDTGDYDALRDGSWDAVVDVSGYVPGTSDKRWTPSETGQAGTCLSPVTRCTSMQECSRAPPKMLRAVRRAVRSVRRCTR